MKTRDYERELKDAGFWLKRVGAKHFLWTNGDKTIALSKNCGRTSPSTERSFKSMIKRIRCETMNKEGL